MGTLTIVITAVETNNTCNMERLADTSGKNKGFDWHRTHLDIEVHLSWLPDAVGIRAGLGPRQLPGQAHSCCAGRESEVHTHTHTVNHLVAHPSFSLSLPTRQIPLKNLFFEKYRHYSKCTKTRWQQDDTVLSWLLPFNIYTIAQWSGNFVLSTRLVDKMSYQL